jgi:predicted O-linked N-acetylglucosamine transferase (SPINDLY family)
VDDYIKKAIKLSQDMEMLSSTRYLLRKMMRDSPLMNAESLTRSLENAYESMWQELSE